MSQYFKYANFLLNESKRGRNNCYVDLCFINLRHTFSLVFELVPNRDLAIKVSSEVFLVGWRNIQRVQNFSDFIKLIDKITVLRCVDYLSKNNIELLDDDAIIKLSNDLNSSFSDIEKEILKLRTVERVIFILCSRIGLKAEVVDRIYDGINIEEIEYTLNSVRQKLIKKFPSEQLPQFSDKQWNEIDYCLRTTEKLGAQEIDINQIKLVAEYLEYSKELMKDLFENLEPDNLVIENLKNYILKETSEKLNQKISVSEKDIIITENLLKNEQQEEQKTQTTNKATPLSAKFQIKHISILKVAITLSIALIITIATLIILNKPVEWIISSDVVLAVVNGTNAKTTELIESDVITTKDNRKTVIKSKFASIEILENSEFVIGKITSSENIFELKSGKVKFNTIVSSSEYFNEATSNYKIETSLSTLITGNSNFLYSLVARNGFNLKVYAGWLSLKMKNSNRIVYCVSSYNLKYDNSYSLVIPYYKNSSEDYLDAIEQISKLPTDNKAFNYILNNSKEKDVLTLWHLLPIPDYQKKKLVVEKLNELLLFNITLGTSNEGVLAKEIKQDLLDFIMSDLLMRGNE